MVVGTVAAARLAGVSRATINRFCKRGKLSFALGAGGERLLDTAELTRVFGELKPPATSQKPPQAPRQQPGDTVAPPAPDTSLVEELRRQIDRLNVELEDERRERRQQGDRLWEATQKLTRLLNAPDQQPSNATAWPSSRTTLDAVRRTFRRWVDNNSG